MGSYRSFRNSLIDAILGRVNSNSTPVRIVWQPAPGENRHFSAAASLEKNRASIFSLCTIFAGPVARIGNAPANTPVHPMRANVSSPANVIPDRSGGLKSPFRSHEPGLKKQQMTPRWTNKLAPDAAK